MVDCVLTDSGAIELTELPVLTELAEQALSSLPHKRALFVRHYLASLDPIDAYIKAGYAEGDANSNCYRLLHDSRVIQAIDVCLELKVERIAISADWIEQEYLGLYKEARHNKDRATARQCLKDLGEHHAMFIKRFEVKDTTDVIDRRLIEGRKRVANNRPVLIEQTPETVQ